MGKKNRWFGGGKKEAQPLVAPKEARPHPVVQIDYNNACAQLGDFVFKTQLHQAEATRNEQACQPVLQRIMALAEELERARTMVPPQAPPNVPAPAADPTPTLSPIQSAPSVGTKQ